MRFLKGHQGFVLKAVFSPDGASLATGGEDSTIRLWNVQTGDQYAQFNHEQGWISALSFAPGGTWLASGGHNCSARLWNLNGSEERRLRGIRGTEVVTLAFVPHGLRLPGEQEETLAFSRFDGAVGLWRVGGDSEAWLRQSSTRILTLAFTTDGRSLSAGGDTSDIYTWDVASRRLLNTASTLEPGICRGLAYAPNGRLLAAALDEGPKVWPLPGGRRLPLIPDRPPCITSSVAFTPDSSRLLAGGHDGVAALYDLSGGVVREVRGWNWGMRKVFGVAVSPDGMLAVAVGAGPDPVVVWDLD